jgi:hypothetical protein
MNQPTDDGDVHDVNINVNVNVVTPTKKATNKMPTKATTVLNTPMAMEKTRVGFGPTVNQPTAVDSAGVDIVDTSQDVEVNTSQDIYDNVSIVNPMKKVTKKIPTKATTALNVPMTKEKARVDFGPTMNQPTVDSTVGVVDTLQDVKVNTSQDVEVNTSQDVEVNMSIVTPTKRVKKSTKAATALKPPKTTKDKTRVNVTRRLCHLCHQLVALDRLRLSCKVCHFNFCKTCDGKGLMVIPFFCTLCYSEACDECALKCERYGESECNDFFPHHICEAE